MNLSIVISFVAIIVAIGSFSHPPVEAQSLQTVNIATAAAGQSGYIAALIDAKGIAAKHGLKINNLMMDFTEAANALKLGRATASAMQPSTAVNLLRSGTDIRLIAPQIWSGNSWLVKRDAPYKSPGGSQRKKNRKLCAGYRSLFLFGCDC